MSLQPRSPLRFKMSSEGQSSSILHTENSSIRGNTVINDLYNKFMTINRDIVIDHDISGFNMAEFQKDSLKLQTDQQLKLKKLENNAQLKRANLELEHRRKKSPKRKIQSLRHQDGYLSLYRQFVVNPSKKLFENKSQSDSDEEHHKKDEESFSGINHYGELKKHPRFLQYTIDKVKEKETEQLEEAKVRIQKIETMKKEIKSIHEHNQKDKSIQSSRAKLEGNDTVKISINQNPEQIADNIFRKIYTKRNKQLSRDEAKTQDRISKIIDKQDSILNTLDQRSLSKENYKKLKTRLGLIVSELYHDDKKHQAKVFLPKINTISNQSRVTQKQE